MFENFRRILMVGVVAMPLVSVAQQADNTRENKNNTPTADQQKETKGDRDLAAKIRKSIIDDKALSTYAHNVKIIVQGGQVTLKGPVRSEQESQSIQAKAQEIAGSSAIHNEMTVAPPKTTSN
jgi:hyperosmotically inducible periplasmic protein